MAKENYLIKYGELGLKGANRKIFLEQLKRNILTSLDDKGAKIRMPHGRLFLETSLPEDLVNKKLEKVFGIVGFAKVAILDLEYRLLEEKALELFSKISLGEQTSFKVIARRSNKSFPYDSMDINRRLGAHLLNSFPQLKVDVHNPSLKLYLEIRERAYMYFEGQEGPGGLPVGTGGKGFLMLSGGIDSPLAGWMLLKRGMAIQAVHFHSPPYTSELSLDKVKELARRLKAWGLTSPLLVVNFTPIQEKLIKEGDNSYLTILMRRMMVRVLNELAREEMVQCFITGESLGQVASQTVESLHSTGALAGYPIFRPLIGLDKEEITRLAKSIGTYDTSIQPFADCCQVFVPKHPITKPKLAKVEIIEEDIDFHHLIAQAVENTEKVTF